MKTSSFYRIAKRQKDTQEISGTGANPDIIKYLQSTNLSTQFNSTDETPWCSAFVNWVVEKAGVPGTNRADAVSWMNWGEPTRDPRKGSIVVFKWANGGHHVGFVDNFDKPGKVSVLGGNQGNTVKISDYDTKYVMGYRNPAYNFFSRTVKLTISMVLSFALIMGAISIGNYLEKKK